MGYIIGLTLVASWLTHVVSCIAAGAWGLLIAGSLLAPIGIIHGVMIWFGYSYL